MRYDVKVFNNDYGRYAVVIFHSSLPLRSAEWKPAPVCLHSLALDIVSAHLLILLGLFLRPVLFIVYLFHFDIKMIN